MTHLTDLQLSMYADAALPEDESNMVSQHLASCTTCQASFAAATEEIRFISSAMQADTSAERTEMVIPKFSRPASLREFAIANLATGLVIWLAQFLWKTLFGELIMNAATWITSVYLPNFYELTSATALYYLQEGTAMFDAYLGFIVLILSTLTALGLVFMYRRSRSTVNLCFVMLLGVMVVVPVPASALEIRRDQGVITIPEDETIDDTLLAAGERIVIKGRITGDLLVAARRIDVDGTVEGNLIAFAETVTVRGKVGGMVLGAGSTFELAGASVGGDFWAAGDKVTVDNEATVTRNATIAGQNATVDGSVGSDLHAFAEIVELNAEVGEDLEAYSNRVRLLDDAHVFGNARLHVPNEDKLERSASARVDGELEFLAMPEEFEETNKYASIQFYLWQIARLVSAVLVGAALLWLVPGFRNVTLSGGLDGLKTAGIGLVTLVSVPVIALIVAITLVGLPFSFIAIIAWLLLLYLAKIVVGVFVGRMMLSSTKYGENTALVLLAGITTILVAVNLPAIGGVISFLLTIVGAGLIVQRMFVALSERETVTH